MITKNRLAEAAVAVLVTGGIAVAVAAPAYAATAPFATATARMSSINVPGADVSANTPTTVSNDGTGSAAAVTQSASGPGVAGSTFVRSSSAFNYQLAQAGTGGTSLACSAMGVGLNSLHASADGKSCTAGAGFTAANFNIGKVPVVNTALNAVGCPSLFFSVKGMITNAYSDGSTSSGGTSATTLQANPCGVTGSTLCASGRVPLSSGANDDFLAAIIASLRARATTGCTQVADALQSVADQITFVSNYQATNADGSFTVIGLHFTTNDASNSFDFDTSTVGPNLPVVDTPMLSTESLSLLGGTALLVLLALGFRRRLARQETR